MRKLIDAFQNNLLTTTSLWFFSSALSKRFKANEGINYVWLFFLPIKLTYLNCSSIFGLARSDYIDSTSMKCFLISRKTTEWYLFFRKNGKSRRERKERRESERKISWQKREREKRKKEEERSWKKKENDKLKKQRKIEVAKRQEERSGKKRKREAKKRIRDKLEKREEERSGKKTGRDKLEKKL